MSNKVFPIQNSAACVYKWGWNTLRLFHGTTSSCHRVRPVQISIDNFENFHNTPEVIDDRIKMLNNEWPTAGRGCEYCKNVEQSGGVSDRLYHNQIAGLSPVDFDGTNLEVTPSISEIYLHNTCNMACVYCKSIFSSKINQELKMFGPYPIGLEYVPEHADREKLFDLYKDWLRTNINSLTRLSILGGEPLLQTELQDLLDIVKEHCANRSLEIAINTNLNYPTELISNFVDFCKELILTKKIKSLSINASMDCWGPQAEFVRSGVDLAQWKTNFEYLLTQKWVLLTVHQVITCLTIKTAIDLQNMISEYKKDNPKITQTYYFVDGQNEKVFHPEIFGKHFFKTQLDELLRTMPITTEWDNQSRDRLDGICKLMDNAIPDPARLKMLKDTLDQIDYRRNTNWRALWPEIEEYFIENGI